MASLIKSDLDFILQQILLAEQHAAGANPVSLVPNTFAPFGLRTVDGTYNNLMPGQTKFGAADQPFPQLVDPVFLNDPDGDTMNLGPGGVVTNNDYGVVGNVADADPRIISNLIVDMTSNNPAAVSAFVAAGLGTLDESGVLRDLDNVIIPQGTLLTIPNVAPDEGLSAPFNSWFTFFGQFFDHGLDLVNKTSTETVFIPLQPDDPLFDPLSPQTNFMVLSRATTNPDGSHTNQTTPFVDQNQTYTSHASHQVFLREYELNGAGRPVATGNLIDGADGGLANWADVKAQALMLGIALTDLDVLNVPLLRTDAYGKFIPGANGFAQIAIDPDGILNSGDEGFVEGVAGGLAIPATAVRTGHAFLDDIAHNAKPVSQSGTPLAADGDDDVNVGPMPAGTYDDDLLARHFITGDGRGNENIALSAVHHVFHSEHNRQVAEIKATVLATGDAAFIASWQLPGGAWNGERLFQAARFATEMQYQHLVFEEFARKMQPAIDGFLPETNYDTTINPAIVAEFAHAVFRVGHSMLTETVDRLSSTFVSDDITLIEAFLNPLEFTASGPNPEAAAGAIVRGMTRQEGNAIDEFVTDALRNSLLGLPLDLAALNIARGRDTGVPTLNAARREFYATTADPQLKPYTSWADLTENLKHEASVINFIAAYGTHATIAAATTMVGKRAAAELLVFGDRTIDPDGIPNNGDETVIAAPTDRLDFLNSTGAYVSGANGVTTTGVDAIDLWIGGLAEKTMPFGGMLGSTFNFVFETQMEALQNGDRFYYLSRLAGLNFLTEMENNTFAKLVMLNTDATHLPADIFSTPGFILEVNQENQHTGLGLDGNDDPVDEVPDLIPLVIRDNPGTTIVETTTYLQYTGGDHVVLGGSASNDTLIASIGDDTIYGDDGNDRIEGGDGNDHIMGGADDDIITDRGGDDVIKGDEGNDVIHGGQGFNLIIAGSGKDFVITGEDVSEVFAGQGDDFVLGSKGNLPTLGNEGHDWIELGTQDGTTGDSSDPLFRDLVIGNDVLISGGGFDELIGEGGDDIFAGSDGEDHFDGGSGFDWAIYKFDPYGVSADMIVNDFVEPPVAPSSAGIMDRFAATEGLSGSAHADVLRGDNADATEILQAGANGSVLTNLGLITGLAGLLGGATSFGSGNIILGGGGGDLIEGRGGNDIIDGDAWLNVRVLVTGHVPRQEGQPPITSVDSIKDLVPYMLSGEINPSQLRIEREILVSESAATDFDTVMFSGLRGDYTVVSTTDADTGVTTTTVADNEGSNDFSDGTDVLRNIERLQFSDAAEAVLDGNGVPLGVNNGPVGALTVNITAPQVGDVLTVSSLGITDADIAGGTLGGRPVSYRWQYEPDPDSGRFRDIVDVGGAPATATGASFTVTTAHEGFALRVRAVYQDDNGVLENVFSAATNAVAAAGTPPAAPGDLPTETLVNSTGVRYIRGDLQFILDQILISERHAAGEDLSDILPNSRVPWGVRTVDGTYNNLVHPEFGAADTLFPRLVDPVFQDGDSLPFDPDGPGPLQAGDPTSYASNTSVADADPRVISNLIVDQTANNPAAVAAGGELVTSPGLDGVFGTADDRQVYLIPNTAPDEGLSAPFNAFMTFFGQFFDHGLDLVGKGGNGAIFVQLQPDDPLFNPATPQSNFLVLTRATQAGPGADGIVGDNPLTVDVDEGADDTIEAVNKTTPFIDQNQTYTSAPSHQVFVREYAFNGAGDPVSTGRLITNRNLVDLEFGNGNDFDLGGMATWAVVKAQARDMLGIQLDDRDALDLPLLAVDEYGNFIPGDNGFAQIVTMTGLVEGNPNAPVDASLAIRTGHAFLDDIAHNASPNSSQGAPLNPDADGVINTGPIAAGFYDNELLDAHYIAGDGRANENIALTGIHHVFHSEHNRLVEHTKDVILASNDQAFIDQWQLPDGSWNGERLFQAARFGTEMQYQHLVFEEFARKVQPQIDIFFAATQVYDTEIDPSIVAEFAHTVYRFGHSMLTETVDRFDADFDVIGNSNGQDPAGQQLGLIAAFLNPLEFAPSGLTADEAAGALARGLTRQQGNEIDEFVTEALRNNLLGLPLDLATINILRGRDTGVPTLNAARRDFYQVTGDAQLKPYASWVEFLQNVKHPESVVNFMAAYGTHSTITEAIGMANKRDAAIELLYGVDQDGSGPVASDRLAFLNSTLSIGGEDWRPSANGVTTTGVDAIDLWIGGLAEKQMPFGGLLGSTFNFVFEEQMEKLQDGDRFYYLERTQGLNFLTELENNTFARLVMANTDATHLPGDVFTSPGFTLEVDPTLQFTGLGLDGRDDPDGVLRDDPGTTGPGLDPDPNYLKYSGDEHVVLGGTAGDDTMIASIGDDTLWGDGGDDRLEGGFGNDFHFGGAGDDIMTDAGGDDNMQGGDGNDAIHGGNGANLILGGFGNDFIVTGEDPSESFGGPGNDFILGARGNEFVFGNEGDDWIQIGMADGSAGENFDAFARDQVVGHDVFIGNTISDRMDGEGGDDIMFGNGGQVDRYEGGSGFDWAGFKDDEFGVTADLLLRAFDETPVPLSNATVLARFTSIEGMSGSDHADVLSGDENDAAAVALSGATGSVLNNAGIDRIDGLRALLEGNGGGDPVTSFAGNIILGGGGSDLLEGRGGNDFIDGDSSLNVRISVSGTVDPATGDEYSYDTMTDLQLQANIFNGTWNPGQLTIVREIVDGANDFDTAVFSDVFGNYDIVTNDAGQTVVSHRADPLVVLPGGFDGDDIVVNIERLQFSDTAATFEEFVEDNFQPEGQLRINDTTPRENQLLTALKSDIAGTLLLNEALRDPDNISVTNPTGLVNDPIAYYWQAEVRPGIFEDILIANAGGEVARATGPTFRPSGFELGLALRVRAVYLDDHGVLENVYSAATAPVTNVNSVAQGQPTISDSTPTETETLVASVGDITDGDGVPEATDFSFQWQQSGPGGVGDFINIVDATESSFTPDQAQVNTALRVIASFTDDAGTLETTTSAPTIVVGDRVLPAAGVQILTGNAGQDWLDGGDGNDTINGLAEDDRLNGDAGNDILNGGDGDDVLSGGADQDRLSGGNGNDTLDAGAGNDNVGANTVDGGAGNDRFIAHSGDGNDLYQGGAGVDTYDLSLTSAGVTIFGTVSTSPDLVDGTGVDSLAGIENIIGSQGADDITVNGGANVLDGQGGNDTINAGTGADTVSGGEGDDTLTGGAGADTLDGNAGDDTFIYTIGDGADAVDGGEGTDDRLNIVGTGAANTLAIVLTGSVITGFAGSNLANVESVSADLLGANDTLAYTSTLAVTVDLAAESATGFSSVVNIENVTGGLADDILVGSGVSNVLNGGAGADTITGGAGVLDTLNGGAGIDTFLATVGDGNDVYVGGGGQGDTYDLSATATTAIVNLQLGTSSSADTGNDTLATIERVVGSSAGDTLTGSAAANTLEGGGGNDTINGGGGSDLISGGDDNDILNGGDGADVISGGAGIDTVNGGNGNDRFVVTDNDGSDNYIGGAGNDTYDLSATSLGAVVTSTGADTSEPGADTLNTIENVVGSTGNDSITLQAAGANVVDGLGGDDVISTFAGNDRLIGGLGDDIMDGGAGNDIFEFAPGFGFDRINFFDANGAGGQDRIDITGFAGINAGNFGDLVSITSGVDTLIEFGDGLGSILLVGVNGVLPNAVTAADFILSP